MISGESSAQPSPPPPDSHLITAELEGSTLTRAQYNTICSLTSSLLRIPTGDLVYDGHTLNPLTLHWHCSSLNEMFHSRSLYTEMAQAGIRKIHTLVTGEIIIPQLNVSEYDWGIHMNGTKPDTLYSVNSGNGSCQCCK